MEFLVSVSSYAPVAAGALGIHCSLARGVLPLPPDPLIGALPAAAAKPFGTLIHYTVSGVRTVIRYHF